MAWSNREIRTVALRTLLLFFCSLILLDFALALLRPSPDENDAQLGWILKRNYRREFVQRTLGDEKYLVFFSTNADRFRTFGTDDKAPVKILVLGDSFTADPYASDEKMWYGAMAERLMKDLHRPARDAYVLAGGAGGWGTYQELLLSQRIARKVKPNLFVLQFCSNDFQNNTYEWESKTVVRGQYMRRPYARLDGTGPVFARGFWPAIYRSFIGRSRLFNRIDSAIGGIQYRLYGGYSMPLPADEEKKYERDSVALTRLLLIRLRKEYSGIPAVMVNCDGEEVGPNRQWTNLARDAGFIPVRGPSDALLALKPAERKRNFNSDGSHLSNDGNLLFGTVAGDDIAKLGLIR